MIAGTNAVASHSFYRFGGRLRGVLAGARGTWAGVVLGHKAAVLGVMPQAGQPHCGIVSKSTVLVQVCMSKTTVPVLVLVQWKK